MIQVYIKDRVIDITDIPEGYVDVLYIARTLSKINRYGGHTPYPYSVAQHAVLVSHLVPAEFAYEALHHDDTEAYIGDVISPIKGPSIRTIEGMVRSCIAPVLGLADEEPAEVKAADLAALQLEQALIQGRLGCLPAGYVPSLVMPYVRQMHYRRAEELYLERHKELERGR